MVVFFAWLYHRNHLTVSDWHLEFSACCCCCASRWCCYHTKQPPRQRQTARAQRVEAIFLRISIKNEMWRAKKIERDWEMIFIGELFDTRQRRCVMLFFKRLLVLVNSNHRMGSLRSRLLRRLVCCLLLPPVLFLCGTAEKCWQL